MDEFEELDAQDEMGSLLDDEGFELVDVPPPPPVGLMPREQ